MENPKQAIYAPEELFALKPETTKMAEGKTSTPSVIVSNQIPAVVLQPINNKTDYWGKYKWYIVGGTVIIVCVSLFIYSEKQKKKRNEQEN